MPLDASTATATETPTETSTPTETLNPETPTPTPTETMTPLAYLPESVFAISLKIPPGQNILNESLRAADRSARMMIPQQQTSTVTIDYAYDPLYRLTSADYSTGDTYHYTYDSVGNRLTQENMVNGQSSTVNYNYDIANRLADVDGVSYVYDANGNLLSDGQNTYVYDSANRLTSVSGQSSVSSYQYNGLGDRLSQDGVNYTLDLNAGLTQVLNDGTTSYTYGLGRISQTSTTTEYFLGDALGSVRQLSNTAGEVTYAKSYDPYGVVTQTSGEGQSAWGYTGEQQDSYIKLIYLRSRMYSPVTGRFTSKDSWLGDYNRPLSLNRWNYTNGNPINYTDPSGRSPISSSQVLSSALSQYAGSSSNINILAYIADCSPLTGNQDIQYDLTGYLALAMTKHGQDARVKEIASLITWALPASAVVPPAGSTMLVTAYLKFYNLEANYKVWDIKRKIEVDIGKAVVLCRNGIQSCKWFDYSTIGNIHFGYIAGLAKINYFISGVLGGVLEQKDLLELEGKFRFDHCGWTSGIILFCDNPQDQYAVDFGFELAKKYPNGISAGSLRNEMETAMYRGLFGMLQGPPSGSIPQNQPALPEINHYDADRFNN